MMTLVLILGGSWIGLLALVFALAVANSRPGDEACDRSVVMLDADFQPVPLCELTAPAGFAMAA